ncbi:MAG: hypothetical protein KKD74_13760 [Bacteroidetes bacterium]|nr:hypothetical protein [Bacteroidota bacterium]
MNQETKKFVYDQDFEKLFSELFATHKPIKAKIEKKKLVSLGLLITKFQRLELTIKYFIGILANIANDQQLIHALLSKYSFSNFLLVLETVATQKQFHRMDDLKLLLKKATKAEEIRNQLIHSTWSAGGRFKTTIKHGKGVVHTFDKYSSEELTQITEMVNKIDTAISAIEFDFLEDCHKKGMNMNEVKHI